VFRLSEADEHLGDTLEFARLEIDFSGLPPLTTREGVCAYGSQLTKALYGHTAVKRELEFFFKGVDVDAANLQFAIGTSDGERYRWETLYTDPEFLAVRGYCTLKRIVPSGLTGNPAPRHYHGAIRMAAFLSPARVPSAAEYEAIVKSVQDVQAKGLDIELAVYVGEQSLLDKISQQLEQGLLKGVTVKPLPSSTQALEKVLKDEPVQLLHFFCHGHLKDGIRFLRFSSISDHMNDDPEGTVDLSIDRLREIQGLQGATWLTVLNSCSGAQDIPGLYSMAATLARSACPVTIGMAEQIHAKDATMFVRAFYPDALGIIRTATAGKKINEAVPIDLGPALGAARRALYKAAQTGEQDGFRRWCLPVMYQRAAGLTIMSAPDPAMMERIETVAKFLRMLPSDAPRSLREEIIAVLDKPPTVPQEMRPNLYGSYSP
jgi:hypothetical protein